MDKNRLLLLVGLLFTISKICHSMGAEMQSDWKMGQRSTCIRPIRIGAPLTNTGRWRNEASNMFNGFEMWARKVNSTGGILLDDARCPVELVYTDVRDSEPLTKQIMEAYANGTFGVIDFYFAPYSSTLTSIVALAARDQGKLVISGHAASESVFQCDSRLEAPCSVPYGPRFENTFGLLTPSFYYFEPTILLFKIRGVRTVAIFYEDDVFTQTVFQGAKIAAEYNRISVIAEYSLSRVLQIGQQGELVQLINSLSTLQPDAVIGCTYLELCVAFIKLAKQMNYCPKALAFATCVGDPLLEQELGEDRKYITGPSQWDHRLKGVDYRETDITPLSYWKITTANPDSPLLYYNEFISVFGTEPNYRTASATAMGYVLQIAVERAGVLDTEEVVEKLKLASDSSFYGKLAFDKNHMNSQKLLVTYQYNLNGVAQVVSPLIAASEDFVYPMPTWDERVATYKWFSKPPEIIISVLTALCIVFTVAVFCVLYYHRETKYVKASSLLFCTFILIGALVLYSSLFFWTLEANDFTCQARIWLAGMGFVFMFGCALAKEWRINKIFNNNKKLSKHPIPIKVILRWVAAVMFVEALILALWSIIAPHRADVRVLDIHRPSLNYRGCSSDAELPFTLILGIYKTLIVLFAIYLAWKTRNVKGPYSESKHIAIAVYNVLFVGLILATISLANIDNREATYVIRSGCILYATTVTICVIFLPKLWRIYRKDLENSGFTVFVGRRKSTKIDVGLQNRIEELEKENIELKRKLDAIQSRSKPEIELTVLP